MFPTVMDVIDDWLKTNSGQTLAAGESVRFGINRSLLSRFHQRPVTNAELESLSLAVARDLYAWRYYHLPCIDRLPWPIQPLIVDAAICHGPRRAICFLQQVCNDSGMATLRLDGIVGPLTFKTVEACHRHLQQQMLNALIHERAVFFRNMAAADRTKVGLEEEWLARAVRFLPASCTESEPVVDTPEAGAIP